MILRAILTDLKPLGLNYVDLQSWGSWKQIEPYLAVLAGGVSSVKDPQSSHYGADSVTPSQHESATYSCIEPHPKSYTFGI